ncbi:glycoside hydrolase family 61 protein [Mycena leptocephala]|nr:glycoside hydrolase family 61 protein [Mycena leptocephala]
MTVMAAPFFLLATPYVSAHGFVHKVWIGTETFLGNTPNAIDSVDPVKGANNPSLNCGNGAQLASDIADANPGDTTSFLSMDWWDLGKRPHNIGPMLTSAAPPTARLSIVHRQIVQDRAGGAHPGRLTLAVTVENAGVPANVTLPANIAPGAYLIRHEIIALQLATVAGGAEFYPSSSQVHVGGSGTDGPKDSARTYTFPGPPIVAFVGASSSGSSSGSGSASGAAPTSSAIALASSSKPKGKSCKSRRVSPTTVSKRAAYKPCWCITISPGYCGWVLWTDTT